MKFAVLLDLHQKTCLWTSYVEALVIEHRRFRDGGGGDDGLGLLLQLRVGLVHASSVGGGGGGGMAQVE